MPIVGIGASAGGVEALQSFFAALPDDPGMAFVVLLHLPSAEESHLPSILQSNTDLPVATVEADTRAAANHVYVLSPGHRLRIEDGVLKTTPSTDAHDVAVVDAFFRSLAHDQGESAVGIVLSGTGTDGTLGLRAIKEEGGVTMAQDPDEAAHAPMPTSAQRAGLVDRVAPVRELVDVLLRYRTTALSLRLSEPPDRLDETHNNLLRRIRTRLLSVTGHDYTHYKHATILRRIERRLRIRALPTLDRYIRLLQSSEDEVWALHHDLLITVTNFFRDPDAFDALRTTIIPDLFERAETSDTIRVWVAGCATGEEAYSIAILLLEHASQVEQPPRLQVFATDVDHAALQFGREGLYPRTIEAHVSPERLERFFDLEMDHYRVRPRLRETILFAQHNVLVDPPFSNLDLVSCRNLLIYLDREAQDYIFRLMHYALKESGVLFLGRSEAGGRASSLFAPITEKGNNIFRAQTPSRKPYGRIPLFPGLRRSTLRRASAPGSQHASSTRPTAEASSETVRELHERVLMHDVPSMIVDQNYEIVHLSQRMGHYLELQGGDPSLHLLSCIPDSLRTELRSMLYQAFSNTAPIVRKGLTAVIHGTPCRLDVMVRPVTQREGSQQLVYIRFDERARSTSLPTVDAAPPQRSGALEDELDRTHEQLRAVTEEYQASTEEMEAANEELLSMNEELQSKNEELETSQEELQSVNEELKTTNQELKTKVEEVREAKMALENLMAITQVATLFLDQDRVIQRFTPNARDLFNIRPIDVGRPLSDLTHQLAYDDLTDDVRHVIETGETLEREVQRKDRRWFLARLSPYTRSDGNVQGVVLTFVDITGRRMLERDVVNASEEERQRIGQDLHDILSSDLAALTMRAENLKRKLEENDVDAAGEMERIITMARKGATQARTLSHALVPVVLEDKTLAVGLDILCQDQNDLLDVTCVFEGDRSEPLPQEKDTAIHLYRIAHEAIMNALKHAQASEIRVRLHTNSTHLVLTVRDDGVGMHPADRKRGGLGLRTMQYRAHLLGGTLSIRTRPPTGTVIRCEVPLPEARSSMEAAA